MFSDHSEEFVLEMFASTNIIPTDKRTNFTCEFVWNSTSFDRMFHALNRLESRERCVSQYIYHKLMGHDIDDVLFKIKLPDKFHAPRLPTLNDSQISAIKAVLQRPLSLIQVFLLAEDFYSTFVCVFRVRPEPEKR